MTHPVLILLVIALVAWILTQAVRSEPANRVIWIVAAILAVLVALDAFVPGVWRS